MEWNTQKRLSVLSHARQLSEGEDSNDGRAARRGRLDCFLSELEDTLHKDREEGRPVESLQGFAQVVRRAYTASAESGVFQAVKTHHGRYLIAHPDGKIRADSQNPGGEWERFEVLVIDDVRVMFKDHHGKMLAATAEGDLVTTQVGQVLDVDSAVFTLTPSRESSCNVQTHYGLYLVALPDGSIKADSRNPTEDWEQFDLEDWIKPMIPNQDDLFNYLDTLADAGTRFQTITYVVNEWSLGGVVRLKHHGCVLTEADGRRHLKFDFGRWGIAWTLSDEYPDHPKGTCLVQNFNVNADPIAVKRFCERAEPFSWTSNNCSSFTRDLMHELGESQQGLWPDLWPTWSHCVVGVKVPGRKQRSICV